MGVSVQDESGERDLLRWTTSAFDPCGSWPWLQVLRFSRGRRMLNKAGFMCQLLWWHYEKRGQGAVQNCQCSSVARTAKTLRALTAL